MINRVAGSTSTGATVASTYSAGTKGVYSTSNYFGGRIWSRLGIDGTYRIIYIISYHLPITAWPSSFRPYFIRRLDIASDNVTE